MGATPAFASVGEAIEMARAALGYLAAVDATRLAAEPPRPKAAGTPAPGWTATPPRASRATRRWPRS